MESKDAKLEIEFESFLKAANSGDSSAMWNLAVAYEFGDGVTQDDLQAFKWYKLAAESGDIDAMESLGICYYLGRGTNPDFDKAFAWLKKAADQYRANAMFYLGLMHVFGKGVRKDLELAFRWMKRATEYKHVSAMLWAGKIRLRQAKLQSKFNRKQEFRKFARFWFDKATRNGNKNAREELRKMDDEDGNFVVRSIVGIFMNLKDKFSA